MQAGVVGPRVAEAIAVEPGLMGRRAGLERRAEHIRTPGALRFACATEAAVGRGRRSAGRAGGRRRLGLHRCPRGCRALGANRPGRFTACDREAREQGDCGQEHQARCPDREGQDRVMQHGDGLGSCEPIEGPTPSECRTCRQRFVRLPIDLERRLVRHAAAAEPPACGSHGGLRVPSPTGELG